MVRRMNLLAISCLLLCGISFTTQADTLTLKNGDRISGQILKSDGKKITVKTEFMGTVEIAWDAVNLMASTEPVYLTLTDNQTVVGKISASGEQYEIETKETGKVKVAKAAIASVRNAAEFNAWKAEVDRLQNPGLLDLWAGALDVGLSLARGNAEANTFTLAGNAVRATPRDKITVYATSIRASARKRTETDFAQVANAIRGGARYDVNLSSRSFVFGTGDLEFDEFQSLDLRMSLGGGFGYKPIKTDRTTLDVFGGGAYTKEYFAAGAPLKRSRGEILLGEEFTHKLSTRSLLRERLVFFPNMSQRGEYRLQFDTSLATNLNRWLAWQITYSNRYLSNPPVVVPALKKSDSLLTTGLRLTFAK
jgi:putative salt-induced outer membrane protein YdiY